MFKERLENVRLKGPLVHNLTNYVTVNDCANMLLACGGSPIMADDLEEVEEIQSLCSGLNINIGTLNQSTIPAMILAGKKANTVGHPVLLDPVGTGASNLRTSTALTLLREIQFTVIRGNISEIKALSIGSYATKGVDAAADDMISDETLDEAILFAKGFANRTNAIVAITGAIDIVANSKTAYVIRNGHPMMSKITGTGCMLSALVTAYISANPDDTLEAVAAAVCAMGLCGELAHKQLCQGEGNASYRNRIIDEIYNLSGEALTNGALYAVR